ncbi:unnamed protein product [Nezara viridula]|uniref:Uncharacterized protein n=1 Tax=Nezara viridula TaxID=85310 RepID=A0A9P0EIH6_NEZVI|nr:unnamed protein product [Nezara viridula]
MACTVPTCQAIFHGKCLNADESEFEALRALRKNWECPKCEKARKNIQPTDKCLSPPRSAPQQQTVDSTSQLLLAAIKNLTEEVKGLKFSLDANANEEHEKKPRDKGNPLTAPPSNKSNSAVTQGGLSSNSFSAVSRALGWSPEELTNSTREGGWNSTTTPRTSVPNRLTAPSILFSG